jgi:hypothetical protein
MQITILVITESEVHLPTSLLQHVSNRPKMQKYGDFHEVKKNTLNGKSSSLFFFPIPTYFFSSFRQVPGHMTQMHLSL